MPAEPPEMPSRPFGEFSNAYRGLHLVPPAMPPAKKFDIGLLLCLYLAILVGLVVLLFATRSDLVSDLVSLVFNVLSGLYRSWANF
jgi:hypothetical protein